MRKGAGERSELTQCRVIVNGTLLRSINNDRLLYAERTCAIALRSLAANVNTVSGGNSTILIFHHQNWSGLMILPEIIKKDIHLSMDVPPMSSSKCREIETTCICLSPHCSKRCTLTFRSPDNWSPNVSVDLAAGVFSSLCTELTRVRVAAKNIDGRKSLK